MTDLSDILSIEAVHDSLSVPSKKALFAELAALASRLTGFTAKDVLASLSARERLGSTGFGSGVGIPHGKLEGLTAVRGAFVRLQPAIEYQSVDGLPVDLVFLLLSPPDAGADHLKALARVSRVLRDRQVLAKLRGARSKDAIYAVLASSDTRDAA